MTLSLTQSHIKFDTASFCHSMHQLVESFKLATLQIQRVGEIIYQYNVKIYLLFHNKLPGSQRTKRLRKKRKSRINSFVLMTLQKSIACRFVGG